MTARGQWRGHAINSDNGEDWFYSDNLDLVSRDRDRDCKLCGIPNDYTGHDPCIRNLPGVVNACCGHGDHSQAYIMYKNGDTVRGADALHAALVMKCRA